ncbi:MAG: InlB B-repeat-containing protein [Paludibacteraceae bacterium]|nr:InlB B-repeat-containing protein [Paludibacteraceae bacterium]
MKTRQIIVALMAVIGLSVGNAWGTCNLYGGIGGNTLYTSIADNASLPNTAPAVDGWTFTGAWCTNRYSSSSPTTSYPSGSYIKWYGSTPGGETTLYAVYQRTCTNTYYSGAPYICHDISLSPTSGDSYAAASKYCNIAPGTSVTITAYPDDDVPISYWTVLDGNTDPITPTSTTSTTFTFNMPNSDVEAEVGFGCEDRTISFATDITKDYGTAAGKYQNYTLSAGSGTITWSSDDDDIASVNNSGVVTIHKAGWTYINVDVANDGTYCAKTDWYKLTINALTPTLATNVSGKEFAVSAVTAHGATFSGGVVTLKGNATITRYGFVIGSSSTVEVGGTGANAPIIGSYWSEDIDLNTTFGSKTATSGLEAGTTYYARPWAYNGKIYGYGTAIAFTTLNVYDITLDKNTSDAGSADGTATVVENATSIEIEAPTRTGYHIEGYYTTEGCATKVATNVGALQASITVSATEWTNSSSQWTKGGDATFYANWEANTYTVTLNQNGGSGGSDGVTATYNAAMPAATMPTTPPAVGKVFDGYWYNSVKYYDSDGSSAHVWDVDGNVTLTAAWTTATPTLTIASVNNIDISSTTPSLIEGGISSVTYGNTVTLSHGEPDAGYYWLDWNVYETGNAGNTVTVTSNQFSMPNHDVTVSANLYTDLVFSCAELTLTPKLVRASTPIFITSMASKTVRSADSIIVVGSGLTPNATITFTTGDSRFEVKSRKYGDFTVKADGTIDTVAYIFYTPAADATIDGLDEISGITASVGGAKPITKSLSQSIIGRYVPENFVIAVKSGSAWYALPSNMTKGTPFAELINVNDNTSPTMAYTIDNNIYTLYDQTAAVRSAGNGQYVKLDMHGQSHAPLAGDNGSGSSTTGVGKSSATVITNDQSEDYWWLLTQTNTSVSATTDVKYEVKVANGNSKFLRMWPAASGGPRWGLYSSNNAIKEIRIIPATVVTEIDLEVAEWAASSIAIKYSGTGTLDGATVAGSDAGSATMSLIGGDIQKIENLTGLSSNPSGLLAIRINEGGNIKQALHVIPFIVTANPTTEASLRTITGDEAAKAMDIVVTPTGRLTTDDEGGVFNNLYIYPGGKAEIGHKFAAENIYMRGGFSWLNNNFALPQMKVTDGVALDSIEKTGNGVYYDLYLDYNMHYMMALPKTVSLGSVTNDEGVKKFTASIKKYNGKNRTTTTKTNCWEKMTSGSVERGVGYEIAIKPRLGRKYGILRFPLLSATAWSNETDCSPSIVGWGYSDGSVTANNKGWNLLGNPFFTAYHNTSEDATKIEQRGFVQHKEGGSWTGTYDFVDGDAVRYFTVPKYTEADYDDVRATDYKLDAFYPFFVQAKVGTEETPGSLTFGASARAIKAPSIIRATVQQREINVDFTIRDENDHTDLAGLNISNSYTAEFDDDDKEKTILSGTQYMKIYTIVENYRVAFNSLPEESAEGTIPVGYIAPEGGTYTIEVAPGQHADLAHLWLVDHELDTQTDLLVNGYEFMTGAGENNTRFTINGVIASQHMPTDIDDTELDQNDIPVKFIHKDIIYIRYKGNVYDSTGKRVR